MLLKQLKLLSATSLLALATVGCNKMEQQQAAEQAQAKVSYEKELTAAVMARTAEERVRDVSRRPAQTLKFFQVEPGMKVAEALPGGGWYSKVLVNYLGSEGALHGINYNDDMWQRFGFFSPEAIKEQVASTAKFPEMLAKFNDNGIASQGFTFSNAPESLAGTLDRVLFIRALHNLNRFEDVAQTGTEALAVTHKLLKKGGMVGLVQHRIPETASAESAKGQRGYLKQSDVIAMFEKAGFELVAKSEMNANPKDQPSESDIVWRLPPTLATSRENPELKAKMLEIGESDRMTLLFKKL